MTINFRGALVTVRKTNGKGPSIVGMDLSNKWLYNIRHGDNWLRPSTVEPLCVVNCWGTLISDKPIEFPPGDPYLALTRGEINQFEKAADQ